MAVKKKKRKSRLARKTIKEDGESIKVVSRRRKRGKEGDFLPKQNVEFADNFEDYAYKLPEERTHTLKDGTKISPREFLSIFNAEYYANDHYKEGSIHKTELGRDYSKNIGENRYKKPINMRKMMAQELSSRRIDVYGGVVGNKYTGDIGLLINLIGPDAEEIFVNKKKDVSKLKKLLNYHKYKYKDIIKLYHVQAVDECKNSDEPFESILERAFYKVILLAMEIKAEKKDNL